MDKLVKFLKEQNLYKEEFFEFMEGKIKVLPYDVDLSWFGCFPIVEGNILKDIRLLVPEIITEQNLLVNIHEYVHALELFEELGNIYEERKKERENKASNYEKIYLNSKKAKKVVNYYVICNKLKNIIRTGWTVWNVKRDRLESVAEHIYGVQMLALAMKSEYKYDIDIMKVIFMLAVHELGETVIGDLTMFQISKEEKEKIEHEAVSKILRELLDGKEIEDLFFEFDEGKTKEAKFAFQCDKLEADLQCKLYGEENLVDLSDQEGNKIMNHPIVKELLDSGESWETMWLKFGQRVYPYDDNFKAVSNYAIENNIYKKKEKSI
ncbi:MAG: HD domain-containing protein [Bacilli bacterium]|nr:HD domain-containing protein [Bacilli bacterium]